MSLKKRIDEANLLWFGTQRIDPAHQVFLRLGQTVLHHRHDIPQTLETNFKYQHSYLRISHYGLHPVCSQSVPAFASIVSPDECTGFRIGSLSCQAGQEMESADGLKELAVGLGAVPEVFHFLIGCILKVPP